MKKEEIINGYLASFFSAMYEIESLEEFYQRSLSTVDEYAQKLNEDCSAGIRISQLFNEVMKLDSIEKRNEKIAEIKNAKVEGNKELQEICDVLVVEELDQPLQFVMKEEYYWKPLYSPNEAKRKLENITKYRFILVESVLSHIIVVYENFLASILRTLIAREPQKYLGNETISFSELIKDVPHAIADKIEAVVESKIWDSLDLLKTITSKEKIDIDRYEKVKKAFEEIYFRRNAYIHTKGCTNKDYLSKVSEEYKSGLKEGQLLKCDEGYLGNSIVILIKLIFYITYELLRNEQAGFETAIKSITDYFFIRLCNKEYDITKSVYYALSKYEYIDFADKTRYRINYINSCKQLGDDKTVRKELRSLDVSAMHSQFVIAKHCLENNTEKILELLRQTYPTSYNAVSIRDWPIFIDFRKTKEYERFLQEHTEDFKVQELEVENQNRDIGALTQMAPNLVMSSVDGKRFTK